MSWSAVGGKSYVVRTNSDLSKPFADASPVIAVSGTGQVTTNYLNPGVSATNRARLYRVRLGP